MAREPGSVEVDRAPVEMIDRRQTQVARELGEGVRQSVQMVLVGLESLQPCLRADESAKRILSGLVTTLGAIDRDLERLASELQPPVPQTYSIEFDDRVIPLHPGVYVIGRGADCTIQFERQRVSRRHAQLTVDDYEASVEDLDSTNGVLVNGRRIASRQRLREHDIVAIGSVHFEIRSEPRDPKSPSRKFGRCELPTLREQSPPSTQMRDETQEADMMEIVGTMAQKWIDQGRAADAERALQGHLQQVLHKARSVHPVRDSIARKASDYALRLARATGKSDWFSYVLELSTLNALELPLPAVVALEQLRVSGVQFPIDALNAYLKRIERNEPSPEHVYARVRLRRLALGTMENRSG